MTRIVLGRGAPASRFSKERYKKANGMFKKRSEDMVPSGNIERRKICPIFQVVVFLLNRRSHARHIAIVTLLLFHR